MSPELPANDVPYRYQEEVLGKAQQGNVIAALNTGSGKTLISLLLINWISSQESSRGKVVIFLAPRVALVIQQWEYLKRRTHLRIGKLHGSIDADPKLSDKAGWEKLFKSNDVFVMTPQIFLNALTHSFWSLGRVSLIIFDECHHARKDNPYNGIMREYFHIEKGISRPKIFGMTASPVWNAKNPLISLAALEANLDAKVITVIENREELQDKSAHATEVIVHFPDPPQDCNYDYPTPMIHDCLRIISQEAWDALDIPWQKILVRCDSTLWNVGPYCASMFLYLELQHRIEMFLRKNKNQSMEHIDDTIGMDIVSSSAAPLRSRPLPDDLFLILDILDDFKSFFPPTLKSSSIPISVSFGWCTPKVKVLADILLARHTQSPKFQGIVFVEQRQVASTLAKVLQVIPELYGKIRCSSIVGEGVNKEGVSKQTDRSEGNPLELFRKGILNILIATSVAEEGLNFPDCELVVRFDDLHHMVGYVQSRGRARKKEAATFIVMIPESDVGRLQQFRNLQAQEPVLNLEYQTRHANIREDVSESDDEVDDATYYADIRKRERYVEPSTGATITYDNALNLLAYLCSLIPRDAFTPVHKPQYTDGFIATLRLPRALPLSLNDLSYVGPERQSYKEAKRAVAFMAVRRLRKLNVFNEFLLPVSHTSDDATESTLKSYGRETTYQHILPMITVPVRDPWCIGDNLWIHPIVINGQLSAGLVTGTALPPEEMVVGRYHVKTLPPKLLVFDEDSEHELREEMREYSKLAIWYSNTSSPFSSSLSLYLVPITEDQLPNFDAIRLLVKNPRGNSDWGQISKASYNDIIVLNFNHLGRPYLLREIRRDLTPMSCPLPGSRESGHTTYRDFWLAKWSTKRRPAIVPSHGPLLETVLHPRSNIAAYSLDSRSNDLPTQTEHEDRLLPQGGSSWLPFPHLIRQAFEVLPTLCHSLTYAFRTRCARTELSLPPIPDKLMIEALTIPSATLPFNNQRLETLGDAVLQLCTTVHLLNRYPNRHEGQLSLLRQKLVNNKYLMSRALDLGLESLVNCEIPSVYKWRYVLDDTLVCYDSTYPNRYAAREYPRRSLQDCMEALLGASFVAGGIPLSLQTGSALGLEFGGVLPWHMRYQMTTAPTDPSTLFIGLEDLLGYKFKHNHLLLESLTHPSVLHSEAPSYQRLEFLGDAILDLVVIKYLYDKFPQATSHQLAHPRTKAICASTLSNVAVRKLGLHTRMLSNNWELNMAIEFYAPLLANVSGAEIVRSGWRFDPPKALSDIFESLIGAVLVDSGYNYDKTAGVVEYLMDDILEALSPDIPKDPVSEVMEWAAKSGCRRLVFKPEMKTTERWERQGITLFVHGKAIVGPIVSASLSVAKFIAAERGLVVLKDPESEKSLTRLCDCGMSMEAIHSSLPNPGPDTFLVDPTELINTDNLLDDEEDHGVVVDGSA